MSEVCVIHLVRKQNGVKPVADFLQSYAAYPAGIEHDLLLVCKGFAGNTIPTEYAVILESLPHQTLFVPDRDFDIGPYFAAADSSRHKYLCFLNSFSAILHEGWLAKLYQHLITPQVGIVGATGSWESLYSDYRTQIENPSPEARPSRFFLRRLVGRYLRHKKMNELQQGFHPFPNHHIRSNAFMISRQLMLSLKRTSFRSKTDVEKFESGKAGLTRQILEQRLPALVVGRDGRAYEKEEWPESRTFRSGNQQNLLVADNRTQQYAQANETQRRELSRQAWGKVL